MSKKPMNNKKPIIRDLHRFPYPDGEIVKCPDCGEKHKLIRISELTGAFECKNCNKIFHISR